MASLLSLTIYDSGRKAVKQCRLVAFIIALIVALIVCIAVSISQVEGTSRHGGRIEWAEARLENNRGMQNPRGVVKG